GWGPDGVRIGLGLVRLAAMADRGAVAVPDSRCDAGEVRLPAACRIRQTKNPGADLGEIVWHPGSGPGLVPACPERLRIEDNQRVEDHPRVGQTYSRQPVENEGDVRSAGNRARKYPLRVDAGEGVRHGPWVVPEL